MIKNNFFIFNIVMKWLLKALWCLMLCVPFNTNGQFIKTKLDFVGGISAREYIHGGLRYQYSDITQLGLYYGGDIGLNPEIINTYCIDNMIHFGKDSYYSGRPVWYARQGFTYAMSKENDKTRKFSYINLAAGREFCVNDWIGFNADLGMIIQVREKTEWKDSTKDDMYNTVIQWLPLLRVQVFISL
jgi:hypothetical protein